MIAKTNIPVREETLLYSLSHSKSVSHPGQIISIQWNKLIHVIKFYVTSRQYCILSKLKLLVLFAVT